MTKPKPRKRNVASRDAIIRAGDRKEQPRAFHYRSCKSRDGEDCNCVEIRQTVEAEMFG